MMVVEFKRLLKRIDEAFVAVLKKFLHFTCRFVEFCISLQNLPPKEKYKVVHRLNRTGFTEKEINLMVFGAYHCRNNC